MTSNKKRPFEEYSTEDYYLCADCDSVYQGKQELCEHLAKHADIRRQARKRICIRSESSSPHNVLDYDLNGPQLISSKVTDSSGNVLSKMDKLSGIEQLTKSKTVNDEYYTFHRLKMAVDHIAATRRVPVHSMKTSLDIIHDINVLKNSAKQLNLPCAKTDLFDRIQAKLLRPTFKQPPLKTNERIITKRVKRAQIEEKQMTADSGKGSNESEYETVQEKVQFQFDASDVQRYLDANSEILGRLESIRREKSFFGVTQEEVDLSQQFAENTTAIVKYSELAPRSLI